MNARVYMVENSGYSFIYNKNIKRSFQFSIAIYGFNLYKYLIITRVYYGNYYCKSWQLNLNCHANCHTNCHTNYHALTDCYPACYLYKYTPMAIHGNSKQKN